MAEDCSWPQRTRPLRQLTEDQYAAWERDGYVVLPGIVPLDLCANAAAVSDDSWVPAIEGGELVHEHAGHHDAPSPRPAHGPCGMVQLYHHATLWALRRHPAVCGRGCVRHGAVVRDV